MCQFFCFACVVLTTTIASGLLYSLFSSNDFFYLVSSSGDHFFHTNIISSLHNRRCFSFFSLLSAQNPKLEHRQTPSMLCLDINWCALAFYIARPLQAAGWALQASSSSPTEDIASVVHIKIWLCSFFFFLSFFFLIHSLITHESVIFFRDNILICPYLRFNYTHWGHYLLVFYLGERKGWKLL